MDALSNFLIPFFKTYCANKRVYVGFSGGMDSHVLLHVSASLRSLIPFQLSAIHVNHNIQHQSHAWEKHCTEVCSQLKIELKIERLSETFSTDLENQLRKKRYALFKKYVQSNDILLVAHQQNDQAETLLLQLLRGAGPKGLSAMPFIKPFAKGYLARPLLDISRDDLLRYAKKYQLSWIEDESNRDTRFARNFLRQSILPLIAKRWPSVSATLSRAAKHCASQEKLLSDYIMDDLKTCAGHYQNTLSVQKIMQFNVERRQMIFRVWILSQQFKLPSEKKLNEITKSVLKAGVDRQPYLSWDQVEVRRYRDDLYVMEKLKPHDAAKVLSLDQNKTIRFRQGGEKIKLPGRTHHHSLKKILQAKGIPPWLRDRVPLVYENDELVEIQDILF